MFCPKCGAENKDIAKFCTTCGCRLNELPPETKEQTTDTYAGFWIRLMAIALDTLIITLSAIILLAINLLILGIFSGISKIDTSVVSEHSMILLGILGFVLSWLYFTLQESSPVCATLGKRSLGISVKDLDKQRISFKKANVRYWSKCISTATLFIGYIIATFTERKQALHDIIAKTVLLKKPSKPAIFD